MPSYSYSGGNQSSSTTVKKSANASARALDRGESDYLYPGQNTSASGAYGAPGTAGTTGGAVGTTWREWIAEFMKRYGMQMPDLPTPAPGGNGMDVSTMPQPTQGPGGGYRQWAMQEAVPWARGQMGMSTSPPPAPPAPTTTPPPQNPAGGQMGTFAEFMKRFGRAQQAPSNPYQMRQGRGF